MSEPAICLNMIVRNEAHIIAELFDSIADYISTWVIVDTGSEDGTQDLIRDHMARLGIPGELHERPWRDFGYNRSEALTLAQGHGDYIWVMDADDVVVGRPDFGGLRADVYNLRYRDGAVSYWRRQLFRDQMPWRYMGVVHEYAECDAPYVEKRLDGDYLIDSRRLGARNLDPRKYERDRDLLLNEVQCHPDDERSVFYLAQSYFDMGDFENACTWYARRAAMIGWAEETYCAMARVAESKFMLGAPWPDVQDAYLRAWEFRPTRAEALHAIAYKYRTEERYRLGHLFAQRAAEIPLPDDGLFVGAEIYAWRAVDEQSICASWIGRHEEAFALCRRLLARADLPDDDRKRIAGNRDCSAPAMIDAASSYPEALVHSLIAGPRDSEITVSLVAGSDRAVTERSLNSFLRSCLDVARVGRFVVLDAGMSAGDRTTLLERYRFVEIVRCPPEEGYPARLAQIRREIAGRFWLHLGEGWTFFAPESLIGRLIAVLEAEPGVAQVGINVNDAANLTGVSAAEEAVRRTPDAGRYMLSDAAATGPSMFETARLDLIPADRSGCTASLDEVLCISAR